MSVRAHEGKESETYPIRQDPRYDVGSRGKDRIRVVVAHSYLDCGRFRVSSSCPIFIEIEDQENPIVSICESAAENTLSGRVCLKMNDKHGQEEWVVRKVFSGGVHSCHRLSDMLGQWDSLLLRLSHE